jgi:hypothetical protein
VLEDHEAGVLAPGGREKTNDKFLIFVVNAIEIKAVVQARRS